MVRLIECDWYNQKYPNREYLQYAIENYDDLEFEEKLEALKSVFDTYFTLIVDDENEKVFIYGHGYMHEATDEEIRSWIFDMLERFNFKE